MDINKVKIFLMVEEYGSFSKIAEKLSYTPSAVLHMANALEKELGVQLFRRSNRGVVLTNGAKNLHGLFEELFEAYEKLKSAAGEITKGNTLELKILTYSSIATYVLPEILQGFKNEYQSIKISIVVENEVADMSNKYGNSDIIFADCCPDNIPNWIPIMDDEYVAVVPETDFSDAISISRDEMYKYPYICVDDMVIDKYFTYSYFDDIIMLKSVENNSAVSLVKNNIGITVMPGVMMKNPVNGIRTLQLEPKLSRTLGIAYNPQMASWAAEMFVQYVKKNKINIQTQRL
ncbi:MAG: LysR family transcriptional regulator [Clostridia bacterium]|nr:LysR family transcriptional regulator [Clostridia bacterium]